MKWFIHGLIQGLLLIAVANFRNPSMVETIQPILILVQLLAITLFIKY